MASGIFQMIKKDPSKIVRIEEQKRNTKRRDYKGTLIERNGKHVVSFIDKISKANLVEEVYVESFKAYNSDMSLSQENSTCKCLLI